MKPAKVCITGGAGFIGSKLCRRLIEAGVDVNVVDNLSTGREANIPDGARLIVGDILDADIAAKAVEGCDLVFHLAARVAIRSSFDFVVEDTLANVGGTASMLRAAARSGTVRRFISTSSMAVYADAPDASPIAEGHPTRPISPYGISKLAAEQLTHSMCAASGMESAVLRLFNTYGPGQALSPYVGVVTIFVDKLRAGAQPTIFGDGEQARDFVHVSDVVSGFLCAMEADATGETFNIGTGRVTTVNVVLAALASHMNVPAAPRYAEPVKGELRFSVADVGKAGRMLGYRPQHEFHASIGPVVDEILNGGGA